MDTDILRLENAPIPFAFCRVMSKRVIAVSVPGPTLKMIEAGAAIVLDFREDATAWELAEAVYLAMERARRNEHKVSSCASSRTPHRSKRAS